MACPEVQDFWKTYHKGSTCVMFDWEDYLRLSMAMEMESKGSPLEEAYLRSSISRAYYSAFNLSRKFLLSLDISIPDANVHKYVQLIFEDLSNKEKDVKRKQKLLLISDDLADLWEDRKRADYESIMHRLPDVVRVSLDRSEKIIRSVRDL